MSVQFFSHIGICVSDLATSRRFYTEVLGFVEVSGVKVGAEVGALIEIDDPEMGLESLFLERDGSRIELMEFSHPKPASSEGRGPFNKVGLTHLAMRTDDLRGVAARVAEFGGTVLTDTSVGMPEAGIELMYVLDPDGTRVELIQLPGDPTEAPGEPI